MDIKLTEKEQEVYDFLVERKNMSDMFEMGYVVGRQRLAEESVRDYKESKNNTDHE